MGLVRPQVANRDRGMRNLIAGAVLIIASSAIAETWTVDDDGPADFDNIQAAVDAASDGDEILVEPGIYTGTHKAHVILIANKGITLVSSKGAEATIIDGEFQRRGIVTFNSGETPVEIHGFTVRHGLPVEYDYDSDGDINDGELEAGGLLFIESNVILVDSLVSENVGDDANGTYCFNSNLSTTNCTFEGNHAEGGFGGGLSLVTYKGTNTVTIDNCLISNNTCRSNGGGLYACGNLNITITDTTFEGNRTLHSATGIGGAIAQQPGLFGSICNFTIKRCHFLNNIAGNRGGAVCVSASSITSFENCLAQGNIALNNTGGAIYSSGAIVSGTKNVVCGNLPDQVYGKFGDFGGNYIELVCSDPRGACCINGFAILVMEADCMQVQGVFMGAGSNPNDVSCPPPCLGDANADGVVGVDDILILIGNWGPCP